MNDTRWDNPQQIPTLNGPFRIVTPPAVPKFALDGDGKEVAFFVPFPMHIVDQEQWAPLQFSFEGVPVRVYKPVILADHHEAASGAGEESADAFNTVVRMRSIDANRFSIELAWTVAETLLEWIRIKCRHYWLLHGTTGYGALYRCTISERNANRISQSNLAAYGKNVIVKPLTEPIWQTLAEDLEASANIPLAESLFCDALISAVAGDDMKALVEAGVASEVAITQLLLEVSGTQPDSPDKQEFRVHERDRKPFKVKLTEWPQRLGLQSVEQFHIPAAPPDWISRVQGLYDLRNSVVHSGRLKNSVGSPEIASSLFATNALLHYCREQRSRIGLAN